MTRIHDGGGGAKQVQLEENVSLAAYTTLGIGGPARWFATARTETEVQQACEFARQRALPVFVLGGGSNLLVSDAGFNGLVIHIAISGIAVAQTEGGKALLRVGAGVNWDELVQLTVERNLAGMECLAGIPGTVGGTPVQNVGAYGQEVAQTVVRVRCFDTQASTFVELSSSECGFAYRTSLLNTVERGRYIVTRVDFALLQDGAPNLSYDDLRRQFGEGARPTLAETAEVVRRIRRGKGMVVDAADPDSRSAGSFFRNPIVDRAALGRVAAAAGVPEAELPHWPVGTACVKLPAAWLLERAGFVRGHAMGAAGISTKHTLALVNRGGATAGDVAALRDRIVAGVRERFGVELEQEPVSVG